MPLHLQTAVVVEFLFYGGRNRPWRTLTCNSNRGGRGTVRSTSRRLSTRNLLARKTARFPTSTAPCNVRISRAYLASPWNTTADTEHPGGRPWHKGPRAITATKGGNRLRSRERDAYHPTNSVKGWLDCLHERRRESIFWVHQVWHVLRTSLIFLL